MKTTKYLLSIFFVFTQILIYAQKDQIVSDEFMYVDYEYMLYSKSGVSTSNSTDGIENFSFNWSSDFNTSFINLANLELAQKWQRKAWYDKQHQLIKSEIEKKLGTPFSNYQDAKNALLKHTELGNIYKNTPPLKSKYENLYNSADIKKRQHLSKLKILQLREQEIKSGNINNSQYGFLDVNGTLLKDITTLNQLNSFKSNYITSFTNTNWDTYVYQFVKSRLSDLGVEFENAVILDKNNFYNKFSDWDKLGFMQFLLNYEYNKTFINTGVLQIPTGLGKYLGTDIATQAYIESYANRYSGKIVNIWNPDYANYTAQNYFHLYPQLMDYRQEAWDHAERVRQELIVEAINNLLNSVDVSNFEIENLISELNITNQNQKKWLFLHKEDSIKIINYLKNNTNNYIESRDIIFDFLKIIEEIPTSKIERYLELINLLKNNPFVFLEDCININGLDISNYKFLYNHRLPQACVNKLNNLGNGFKDQPIQTGNAAVANVDYYPVEITRNPDFNLDGIPDSDQQVFESYKRNFAKWASGEKRDFQFSCNIPLNPNNRADVSWSFIPYNNSENTLWNSNNPLTAIFKIDANANVFGGDAISDDGAIMISAFTSNYWIGSTIETFWSGTQPFSGNRQWGYIRNQNGNLELYARAVDVARISQIVKFSPGDDNCKSETYYNIGEATWSSLQNQIATWVNANGGTAIVRAKTAKRFDKRKIKQILESNDRIDQIRCN